MEKRKTALRTAAWILCLVLAAGCVPAVSETGAVRILVGEMGVSLRSSPDYTGDGKDGNRIMGISAGTVLQVFGMSGDWYRVKYKGYTGYVTALPPYTFVLETAEIPGPDFRAEAESDMGLPQLFGRVVGPGEMNLTVLWTQTQLQAAGFWDPAGSGGLTGLMDGPTVEAVRAFMACRGCDGHSGWIDSAVILELARCLGRNRVPVRIGGIYRAMDSIMGQGCTGNMPTVTVSGGVPAAAPIAVWVQACLRYLGYYTGGITGRFDEKTGSALNRFQADHGYGERGFLTPGVARTMLECYAAAGGDTKALP